MDKRRVTDQVTDQLDVNADSFSLNSMVKIGKKYYYGL